jgi:hypothetical protein
MNPLKDLNSTPEAKQIANEYCKQRYANNPEERKAKNLRDKAWRRRTGKVPYTHTKSEAEMIADYIAKHQLKEQHVNQEISA